MNFGLEEIQAQAEGVISAQVDLMLDPDSVRVDRNIVLAVAEATTPVYAEEPWSLPLTTLEGAYTVTVEECKLASVFFNYTEGALEELKEAAANQ